MDRLAVLSDVHGNLRALEAVLSDIDAQDEPDAYWILGDLAAFCPWPAETLARLRALPNAAFLQGNTDRYLVTGRRPLVQVDSEQDWRRMPRSLKTRDECFRWIVERLSYDDYLFLRDLPTQIDQEIPDYGRIAAVHATPDDDEINLYPDAPAGEVRSHLSGLNASLLLYGHTHRPVDRIVDDIRVINSGSVGIPLDGDPRPAYALIDFEGDECSATIRRVSYDREAVIAELERLEHPGRAWVGRMLEEASA